MKVLFVCMGNICRSPTVEGVFRRQLEEVGLADRVHVDSAGTHDYHVGDTPDPRSQAAAHRRGVDLSRLRARAVSSADYDAFDLLLAMDAANLALLKERAPATYRAELRLFLDPVAPGMELPDPYYGGDAGFEQVLDLAEQGCELLLQEIMRALPQR